MANPTCTSTTWIENAAAYTGVGNGGSLDPKQQKALELHAMALELAAIGGTDYTAALETTLIEDADAIAAYMNEDQLCAAKIAICYANADSAGAADPGSITDKLEAVKSLVLFDCQRLDKAWTLLRCQLGRAKDYVQ